MRSQFQRVILSSPVLVVLAASAIAQPSTTSSAIAVSEVASSHASPIPVATPTASAASSASVVAAIFTPTIPLASKADPRWRNAEDEEPGSERIDSDGYYKTLYRKFELSLGAAAFTKFNTNLQVNSDIGAGANLDMEDLLGLDEDSIVARLDGRYSFNRRHWLQFSYFDIDRNGEKIIPDDIQVGDETIPAGPVVTDFDTEIIKLAYRYNFVTDTRTVIGASFGFHVMSLDTRIASESVNVHETFKVTAPLPLVGLHGAYALGEKWRLSASAEFLQFDLGDYRGLITDTRLTLDHDTFKHFGWGIGFNAFKADASADGNDDLSADLEYGYQGLMLYLRLLF